MSNDPIFYIAAAAALVVFVVLMIGIASFSKGGAFYRKHANRLMWLRIGAQVLAIMLVLAAFWLRQGG
jgi:hypothetical protein